MHDSGLDLDRLALVQVDFGMQQYPPARARQIVEVVLDQMSRLRNVEAVSAASGLPVGLFTPGGSISEFDGRARARVELVASTPGIFQTLGVSILRGRDFDGRDVDGTQPTAILSAYAANSVFGTLDVVGRTAIFTRSRWAGMPVPLPQSLTIVGVAADTDTASVGQRDHGTVYLPLDQHYEGRLVLAARVSADPAPLVTSLRQLLDRKSVV